MSGTEPGVMGLYLGALIVYSLGLVAFGLFVSRRFTGTESFFVADRSFGPGMIFSTFLAANIGAGSVIAASELGYNVGVSAWWYVGSAGIGQLLFAWFIGPRVWRIATEHELLTAGDYLELRYGTSVRAIIASILWLGTLAILAAQMIAMSQILEWVLGAPRWVGATLGGVIMVIYFGAGGLLTTAWVNLIQLIVLITGLVIAIPIAVANAGGLDAVLAAAPADAGTMNPLAFGGVIMFAILMPAFVVSPGIVQMAYAARDERSLRFGVTAQAVALLLFALVPMSLGVIAHSYDPALDNAAKAVPTVLTFGLPALLGALGLAAVFSAEVSSADTILFMLTTSLSKDIYKRFINPEASDAQILRVARGAAVAGGLGGLVLTLLLDSVLGAITIFYAIMSVSLFVPLVAGLYSRRPGVPEALGAIGTGVTVLLGTNVAASAGWVSSSVGRSATGIGILASAVVFALVLAVRRPAEKTPDDAT
ncbi:MAG: sodium:solute symporter family protein [Gemmatimonadota bacterium]